VRPTLSNDVVGVLRCADSESTRPAAGRRPAQPGERSEAAQRPKLNLEPAD
jgi:hypothetical protein